MQDLAFSVLGMHRNKSCETYLGLPAFTGRNKSCLFNGVKERLGSKLMDWKSKMFSIGVREILIKAVAQAIPAYTMSFFRLPITLCNSIQSLILIFGGGATGNERKLHWKKWKLLCAHKSNGGLGFWDFLFFNRALLAKQT